MNATEAVLKETLDKMAQAIAVLETIQMYGTTCNARGDVAIPAEVWDQIATTMKMLTAAYPPLPTERETSI